MSIAEDSAALDPTSEFLAERLLDLGDPQAALEVLDRALRRDPGSDRARALRSRALLYKRNAHALTPRPTAVDEFTEDLAETYIQRGLLEEAQVVYERILRLRRHRHGPQAARRAELLMRVLSFRLAPSPDPRQKRAEELIGAGRLASALAEYRLLARELPDDGILVSRANDLRILVLGREADDRRLTSVTVDETTAVGASPQVAAEMLEEGRLEEAMVELQKLALARPDDLHLGESLAALLRLVGGPSAPEEPAPPPQGVSTRPMKQVSFVEMHVRLGNLAAAAELYRAMIERSPGDELARGRLADLRVMLRFMRTAQERAVSDAPAREPSGEREAPDVQLKKARRSQELSGYRSSTDLLPKVPSIDFRADEDVTAIVRPEEQAELYLRQGFLEKAAEIYRTLVVRHPQHIRFQERLLYVERKMKERDAPAPGPSVMELTDVTPSDPMRAFDDAAPEDATQADPIVFPLPRAEAFDAFGVAGLSLRDPPDGLLDLLEGDLEKTPVSTPAYVFEDVPTGQDHLADRRLPLGAAAPAVREEAPAAPPPARVAPSASAPARAAPAPVLEPSRAIPAPVLETSPTTLFPAVQRPQVSTVRPAAEPDFAAAPAQDAVAAREDEPDAPDSDVDGRVTAHENLATVMMPQLPIPLTSVKHTEEDNTVSVRRIIMVGPK